MWLGAWLVERYGRAVVGYLLAAAVALAALAGGWGWQAHVRRQRDDARAAAAQALARATAAETRATAAEAQALAQQRAATVAQEAVDDYVQTVQDDRPVVERVVSRVVRDCAQAPAAGRGAGMPPSAGGVDGAAAPPEDDRGRADFATDLGDDLRACTVELEKLRGLQRWAAAVSAPTTGPAP